MKYYLDPDEEDEKDFPDFPISDPSPDTSEESPAMS